MLIAYSLPAISSSSAAAMASTSWAKSLALTATLRLEATRLFFCTRMVKSLSFEAG